MLRRFLGQTILLRHGQTDYTDIYPDFAGLIRQFLVNTGLLPCVIVLSHYEFLYHFVESIFELNYKKDKPLGHGEVIEVSFFDIGIGNVVEIEVTFRKRTIIKNFDYVQKEII